MIDEDNFLTEIFSSPLLNKTYNKLMKIVLIAMVYMRYIVTDFSYETGLKNCLKKLIFSISEILINIGEMFILQKLMKKDLKKESIEKFAKALKSHKMNKNLKTTDLIFFMNKNNDTLVNLLTTFSKS
jgi:hypothetical protein